MLVTYAALICLATVPIYLGSWMGLNEASEAEGGEGQTLSKSDAYWFPVFGSGVLFGLYLMFRFLNKDYINYLLTAYFALMGTFSLSKVFNFGLESVVPERFYMFDYVTVLIERKSSGKSREY